MPEPYEGQPVITTKVKVTGAGDGLSDSIAVDGRELHMGDEVTVILGNCVVAGVDLRPIDKEDPRGPLVANLVLKAGKRATITGDDDSHVQRLLSDTEARVRAAKGEEQLTGTGVGDHGNGPDADTVGRVLSADDDGYYDPEAVDPSTVGT